MALFRVKQGLESTLNGVPAQEGYLYFCTDTGHIFVDIDNNIVNRKLFNGYAATVLRKKVGDNITDIDVDDIFLKNEIIPISNGGTGASTAANARTNLGVYSTTEVDDKIAGVSSSGEISTDNITGILPIEKGGTGATTVSNARTNLGIYSTTEIDNKISEVTANSGVVPGTYGPTENVTITGSGNFVVPLLTADARGRVTDATVRTININNISSDGGTAIDLEDLVVGNSISLNRKDGTDIGLGSVAVGLAIEASGTYAFAEGSKTTASNTASHAEGGGTIASGIDSHAEGYMTIASGDYSHAEGENTKAVNRGSHAEGSRTEAYGISHAEGSGTKASGVCSHAEGAGTIANRDYSHAGGYNNKEMSAGDIFVIGNGTANSGNVTRSNCFRITLSGAVYGLSAFNASGADYAEYFEWLDGNPDSKDRVGYFVTLKNKKIKIASPNDYILGIVSGQPCIIGNADEDWLGRWQHDEFGRFLTEEVLTPITELKKVLTPILDGNGNLTLETKTEYKEIETGEYRTETRFIANPEYDSSQQYIERKDRKEWSAIGMMGVLSVKDDGTCKINGFCKVSDGGIATASEDEFSIVNNKIIRSYQVIERVTDNIIKIVFR